MPADYSLRHMHGGASFPKIGEGAVLGTGVGGIVQPVELTVSRHIWFFQTVPAITWNFSFSPTSMKPLVVVSDDQGQTITDSINYEATLNSVKVWTEGVPLTGRVDLYWFGDGSVDKSGGNETVTFIPEIDGGTY